VSLCLSTLALGKDDGDDEEEAATTKPALPNFYLDMRTIYATLPAGSLSIGFSSPPLLSRLANLSSLRTRTSPSSQSLSVDLPLTVDVNDQLSVYGGVSGATSQAGTDPWTTFSIYAFTVGFQADIYQQNGGMFPTITVQSNATRFRTRRWLRRPTTPSSRQTTRWTRTRPAGCSLARNTAECWSIPRSRASAPTS
jgi:hypothetical protein